MMRMHDGLLQQEKEKAEMGLLERKKTEGFLMDRSVL